jgi:hypothetical protein
MASAQENRLDINTINRIEAVMGNGNIINI